MKDPLEILKPCPECASWSKRWRRRRTCEACKGVRNIPVDLSNLWQTQPGFLVCGGPSLKTTDLSLLQLPGVVSLGVNNAAKYAKCNAMTFGDPQWKFHGSMFLDPKVICFAPTGKLDRLVRIRTMEGFKFVNRRLRECPNVFGLPRTGKFDGKTFLTDPYAHWGLGGKHESRAFTRLASMLLGIRLLHYLGCKTMYLVGVDFHAPDREQGYAWGDKATFGGNIWWKIDSLLKEVRIALEGSGVEVYNCNPESKCTAFDHRPYEEAIKHARKPFDMQLHTVSGWYDRGLMTADKDRFPDPIDL